MQTGFYYDLDFKEYRAMKDAVSISELNVFRKAEILYKHEILDGQKRQTTPQQALGTALHHAYLEENSFASMFNVGWAIDKRTTEGKKEAARREELSRVTGVTFLPQEDMTKVVDACKILNEHPALIPIKPRLKFEASMFWETNGTKCKGRLDAFDPESGTIVDVKTTKDAKNFAKSIIDYGYHRQAAYYLDGLKALTGKEAKEFIWVCIEMDAPHLCAIYRADEMMIAVGRHEYEQDLVAFKKAKDLNKWRGLPTQIQEITLPSWYLNKVSEVEM
jgi:hypothetical protein